jgi:hypothetical protein
MLNKSRMTTNNQTKKLAISYVFSNIGEGYVLLKVLRTYALIQNSKPLRISH